MKASRYWLLLLCGWLFLLYNIERLGEPTNLATFVYVLSLLCVALVLILPPARRWPFYYLLVPVLIVYFPLKIYLGYQIGGSKLPITVTEICALAITLFLTRRMHLFLDQLSELVAQLTLTSQVEPQSFTEGQGQLYREVRRARSHKRPAALVAVAPRTLIGDENHERLVREAQARVMGQYTAARLAQVFLEELRDFDVVTLRNDHFVILLPEVERDQALMICEQLQQAIRTSLGLELNIGLASFPDEEVTFESLLVCAEAAMTQAAQENTPQPALVAQEPGNVHQALAVEGP
ncbi:MAG: diguanylate cyclase [Chloroflexi bacterium]|nr:diguanylate cyclase [Chloroflexota bacterium]MCI0580713.1 diguanylate cyclase [Chloroflexota bacterium]MCI0646630.1 diguanylate cyclase [Chloroflexota bacterium]MCI0729213.1 diguanylate cyclase [Chloroflexota bacterium]